MFHKIHMGEFQRTFQNRSSLTGCLFSTTFELILYILGKKLSRPHLQSPEFVENFSSHYLAGVNFSPKTRCHSSLMIGYYEFIYALGICVEYHQKDKTLFNLAVTLFKDEEQEISIHVILEQDSRFDDEIYEALPKQLGCFMKASETRNNSKSR